MRVAPVAVVIAIVSGAFGFFVGRSRAQPMTDEPSPQGGASIRRAGAGARPGIVPLVCARTRAAASSDAPDCSEAELRARWCEAELDAYGEQRRAVRQPWPEDATIESPEGWTQAIDEALSSCELGAELELVDCSEYPCTAALRPADTAMSSEAHEREMERLMTAVRGCEPLRRSFGIAEDDANLDVFRLDARCGEAREAFFVLMALDPAGAAYEMMADKSRDDFEERDFNRWMYRRADDLAGMWPCGS